MERTTLTKIMNTWDCVDISHEAIEENRAYVFINKESQRIRKNL